MSYATLHRLGVTFRPIHEWHGPLNPDRRTSPFYSSLSDTVATLARELRMLRADRIIVEVALDERQIRLDGFPRADARASHPGVILSFESKWGPLRYATDEFRTWEDNLRAIALAMKALRKVARYGVSKRGEQYTGWRQIPARTGGFPSVDAARRFIEDHGGYRTAARTFHHDNVDTGDEEKFKLLQQARELAGEVAS